MELFTEGQKLTLFFPKNNNMVEMTCVIDKVCNDRLELVLPQYFMRYVEFLQVGSNLTAKAFSKIGTADFNTIVISSPLEDSFVIELDYNSVNLTSGEDLPVIKAVEAIDLISSNGIIHAKTFEVSSEFLKFTSNKKFEIGELVDCVVNLPKDYGTINFKGTIMEIDPIYDTEYTIAYTTMTENTKQNLLYYMYMYSKDIN